MQDITDNNSILTELVWQKLQAGVNSRKSPYHVLSCSYISLENKPRTCHIVIRRVYPKTRKMHFHTDIRNKKVAHLQNNPNIACCVYSKEEKLQIKIYGKANIQNQTKFTREVWDKMQNISKICYANDKAPGSEQQKITNGFSKHRWENRFELIHEESTYANFSIVEIDIEEIEIVHLAITGHHRHVSTWNAEQQQWNNCWLAP